MKNLFSKEVFNLPLDELLKKLNNSGLFKDTVPVVKGEEEFNNMGLEPIAICRECGEVIYSYSEIRYNTKSRQVCVNCFEKKYSRCAYCGDIIKKEESITADDDLVYCKHCFEERFKKCSICREYIDSYMVIKTKYGYMCKCCYDKQVENKPKLYGYKEYAKKYGVKFLSSAKHNIYFGLEIETSCKYDRGQRLLLKDSEIDQYGHYEMDSSITGIEYITHATNHLNLKYMIDVICPTLDNFGFYTGENNGIHIHISKNWYTLKKLKDIIYFIENNKMEVILLSGRSVQEILKWANFKTDILDKPSVKECLTLSLKKGNRYTAVNTTNKNTIEFRLFSSSLDAKVVKGYIEFIEMLVFEDKIKNFKELYKLALEKDYYYLASLIKDRVFKI